ncbi:DUF2637 domain-containing protein [Couchioplanes caeruleus]|uniref:DUF2637 domain-containing protein n=2 Tax=Couchioplanes caeruleus TaxID=56438 RepID=A0A1K0GE56_9ACTN|nr:hypothetical protein [Couchioplanes caeruleus]OJF15514.1 hypothetical protein BG844_04010 [Couchioplanes caeruleus subsp. caeruleus]ROP30948.1 hypothetical protein EDD30_3833 [Couchioplanes caeruleus]
MTAATTGGSAYPPNVNDLLPRAIEYAKQLGKVPSRNMLMKHLKVGADKAKAVRETLQRLAERDQDATDLHLHMVSRGSLAEAPRLHLAPNPEADSDSADDAPEDLASVLPLTAAPEEPQPPAAPDSVQPGPPSAIAVRRIPVARYGMAALLTVIGVLLAGVIVAPIALSSQDIIAWAASPTGLGLSGPWPLMTFFALDAAAAVCVGLVVYCAWRGESAGVFAWLVWAFAGMSAYANYSHSAGSPARDAVWFFPAMSLAGPFLLEIVVRHVRRWVQEGTGRRTRHHVAFGLTRWIPGVGALRETYGAWRLARLDGIDDADQAVWEYRRLCPDGSIRVLSALRARDQL